MASARRRAGAVTVLGFSRRTVASVGGLQSLALLHPRCRSWKAGRGALPARCEQYRGLTSRLSTYSIGPKLGRMPARVKALCLDRNVVRHRCPNFSNKSEHDNSIIFIKFQGEVVEERPGYLARVGMIEKQPKLLEVLVRRDSALWEWQFQSCGRILVCGFEKTRLEARFAGNEAMFLMLASGRDF
jgi:hypothetical protein